MIALNSIIDKIVKNQDISCNNLNLFFLQCLGYTSDIKIYKDCVIDNDLVFENENKLIEELGSYEGKERIIFTGLLNYEDYRKLLWRTNVHCYFTRPYVTSWSLFEAAACGTRLAVSRNKATENVAEENSVNWIDINKDDEMLEIIEKGLNTKYLKRARILKGYELERSLRQWQELLNEAITHSTIL